MCLFIYLWEDMCAMYVQEPKRVRISVEHTHTHPSLSYRCCEMPPCRCCELNLARSSERAVSLAPNDRLLEVCGKVRV